MKKLSDLTINNKKIYFRYPVATDAKQMWEYINTLSKEQTFIRFQGEKISLKEEVTYLTEMLKKIKAKKAIKILAFCDKELIGISDINMQDKTEKHLGLFGITIKKQWRDKGIGKKLMEVTIKEAKHKLTGLKIIILSVFANNPKAIKMYQRFGFRKYGLLPKGAYLKDRYVDNINMYLPICS